MRWSPSGATAGLLSVLAVTTAVARSVKETTAIPDQGHNVSDSSAWKESDLKCDTAGNTRFRCVASCGGANATCSVETVMERCTCEGAAVTITDKAYYSTDSGRRITAVGFQDIASLCESCQSRCRKPGSEGRKSDKGTDSSWQTKPLPCDNTGKSALKDTEKKGSGVTKTSEKHAASESSSTKQEASTKSSVKPSGEESDQKNTEKKKSVAKPEEKVEFGTVNRNNERNNHNDPDASNLPARTEKSVTADESEGVVDPDKKVISEVKTRPRRSAKIRDWTRDIAEQNKHDLDADRVQEGSEDYAEGDDNRGVELGIPQMLQQGGLHKEESSKTTNAQQDASSDSIKSKFGASRNLVKPINGANMSQTVSFDKKLQQDTSFVAPSMSASDISRCDYRGNESRTCTEDCSEDGATCIMRVALQRCTCSGIKVSVVEVQKFDLSTKLSIFLAAPNSARYGSGYVRECGSCVDYCKLWPGESHSYEVATAVLSCGTGKPAKPN